MMVARPRFDQSLQADWWGFIIWTTFLLILVKITIENRGLMRVSYYICIQLREVFPTDINNFLAPQIIIIRM